MIRKLNGNYLVVIIFIVNCYFFISYQRSFPVYGKNLLNACENINNITLVSSSEKEHISNHPDEHYCSILVYGKDNRIFNKKKIKDLLENMEPIDLHLYYQYKNNNIEEIKVYTINNKDISNYHYVIEKNNIYYSEAKQEKWINTFLENEK